MVLVYIGKNCNRNGQCIEICLIVFFHRALDSSWHAHQRRNQISRRCKQIMTWDLAEIEYTSTTIIQQNHHFRILPKTSPTWIPSFLKNSESQIGIQKNIDNKHSQKKKRLKGKIPGLFSILIPLERAPFLKISVCEMSCHGESRWITPSERVFWGRKLQRWRGFFFGQHNLFGWLTQSMVGWWWTLLVAWSTPSSEYPVRIPFTRIS